MQGTSDGILIQICVDNRRVSSLGIIYLPSELLYRLSIYYYLSLAIVNLKKSFITGVELDEQCTGIFKNCIAKSF